MHRVLLTPPASAARVRQLPITCRHLRAAQLHNTSSPRAHYARHLVSQPAARIQQLACDSLLSSSHSSSASHRSYATQSSIQLGATSPQDVGQLLAAASAGDVDKMRAVLERKTCTANDGDYDRRKVSTTSRHSRAFANRAVRHALPLSHSCVRLMSLFRLVVLSASPPCGCGRARSSG